MPKVDRDTTPETLRPYVFHGVDLTWKDDKAGEAIGDCPFCGREGKFSVKIETGQWRCFVCAEGTDKGGGNAYTFIRKLWEMSDKETSSYAELAEDRGLMNADSLLTWEVCRSMITKEWLVPAYGIDQKLNQLYKYILWNGKKKLVPTPTLKHQIFGLGGTFNPAKKTMYVCEGPWDAIALWEVLKQTKMVDKGYAPTSNQAASLLSNANVIAIPGCESFFDHWTPLFADKNVRFMLDNDHDRKHPVTGKVIPAAAYNATRKHVGKLAACAKPPQKMGFLQWSGEDGKAFDPEQPSGYDLRDAFMSSGDTLGDRITALKEISGLMAPVPSEWVIEAPRGSTRRGNEKGVGTVACKSYTELVAVCKKAMKWTDGLDYGFHVMLACVSTTMQLGDQLWVKFLSPASSGKSTLCELISTNKEYVHAVSVMKGFYSGYRDGAAGGQDYSLISKIGGKTLVTKDGDTILQLPNKSEVLAQARDVFDTVSRTEFKNAASNVYEGLRMTWILCGTSALRALDNSELGARFLDCVIMDDIDDELEDEIVWRVAKRAKQQMSYKADGEAKSHQSPEMTLAMQMTSGFIDHLRENAEQLFSELDMSDDYLHKCTRLGKFVAFMRARPSTKQDEKSEREFAARLVSQHVRLANALAVVAGVKVVDEAIMERTTRVAMNTARGVTLDMVKALYRMKSDGIQLGTLAKIVGRTDDRTRRLLFFLKEIGVVEVYQHKKNGAPPQTKWRLTEKLMILYHEVTGEPLETEEDVNF